MFIVGRINMLYLQYGTVFLTVMASTYHGYLPFTGFTSVIIGTIFGFVDAAISVAIFGCVYNYFVK